MTYNGKCNTLYWRQKMHLTLRLHKVHDEFCIGFWFLLLFLHVMFRPPIERVWDIQHRIIWFNFFSSFAGRRPAVGLHLPSAPVNLRSKESHLYTCQTCVWGLGIVFEVLTSLSVFWRALTHGRYLGKVSYRTVQFSLKRRNIIHYTFSILSETSQYDTHDTLLLLIYKYLDTVWYSCYY